MSRRIRLSETEVDVLLKGLQRCLKHNHFEEYEEVGMPECEADVARALEHRIANAWFLLIEE